MNASGQTGLLEVLSLPRYNDDVDSVRKKEYPMLKDLMQNLFGNPHSNSSSSHLSTRRIEDVRLRALRYFKADPADFDLVFVANATAAIKLVVEGFREYPGGFWFGYHRDAHTSLIGVRESATGHHCFRDDEEVATWVKAQSTTEPASDGDQVGLFAYPAQSNLNGRRLPMSWSGQLRSSCQSVSRRCYSLLDAAALVSTCPLDLSDASQAPDYIALSFYKMFGYPDLGALIIRKDSALPLDRRRYFGGGTVEMVACIDENWHVTKQDSLHERLEDGTLPIHGIVALGTAFDVHQELYGSIERVSLHTSFLAKHLYDHLFRLRHSNARPVCTLYKDRGSSYDNPRTQGPIIALNLRGSNGNWISNAEVEKLAAIKGIQLRTGGLCNPGGVSSLLDLAPWEMKRNFSAGHRCGNDNDIMAGKPTGIIRVSFGAMSNLHDVMTFVRFIEDFFVDRHCGPQLLVDQSETEPIFQVEAMSIYPIKSCGAWDVPSSMDWEVRPEGLAWDREWCVVHRGTRAALSQKGFPRMALLRPDLDLETGVLRIGYRGQLPRSVPNKITLPLNDDPGPFEDQTKQRGKACSSSRVCGDSIQAYTYSSPDIAAFFTAALDTPCTLARFPAGPSNRQSRLKLPQSENRRYRQTSPLSGPPIPGAFPTPPPSPPIPDRLISSPAPPILLSNESPILAISRSSLNHLNQTISSNTNKNPAPASVFRANIILAQSGPAPELPYDEDRWTALRISSSTQDGSSSNGEGKPEEESTTHLGVLGPCRRCQVVCIDQTTAERSEEPFVTLAKTRRRGEQGMKVFFGVHCALMVDERGGERVGVRKIRVGDRVVPVRGRGRGREGEGESEGEGEG
ncbi:MAG: hypothetical protein Q9220_001630 [cf. Caloplaca sp. 1 TL-2023]